MSADVFWCKNCLNMSTRPRIEWDDRGWCNACVWMETKKTMDWASRQQQLRDLLEQHRSKDGNFDVLVPVSGGKDGSYVAWKMKNEFGMNPLTVTVRPPLELEIGNENLKAFIDSGFDHVHVTPNARTMQMYNKYGFIEKGFPYYGWLIAILSAVIRTALNHRIPLVMYAEDGDIEYGGSTETMQRPFFNVEYIKRVYLERGYDKVSALLDVPETDLYYWKFPSDQEFGDHNITLTHLSYFEPWDSYRNYLVAKEHCGLEEVDSANSGTFTNFAQNDQALYALHTYLMYLKFGFGRALQDAGIEIRRGAMTRDQAVQLVRMYDGHYPEEYIETYLEYYQMTQEDFDAVLDRYANRELFNKSNNRWVPNFEVE